MNKSIRNILIAIGILTLLAWILGGIVWAFLTFVVCYIIVACFRIYTASVVDHKKLGEAILIGVIWPLNK
jgi:hypothetical protein